MPGLRTVLVLPALAAAVANGICQAQDPSGAGNLTINGSLASGGAAALDTARRIIITSVSDDSAFTYTVTGTDRYGRAQSEAITGGNAAAVYTQRDFLSVTQVKTSGNSGSVTVGTNEINSSLPHVAQEAYSYSLSLERYLVSNAIVEVSYDDLAPAWDMTQSLPVWKQYTDLKFADKGQIPGPVKMIRLTNLSGIGNARLTILTHFQAGRVQ